MIIAVFFLRVILVVQLLFYKFSISNLIGGFYDIQWKKDQNACTFHYNSGINFIDCIEECLRRKRCVSVNYSRSKLFCEINELASYLSCPLVQSVEADDFIFSEKSSWDSRIVGDCSSNPCNFNEICVSVNGIKGFTCGMSDCGLPPSFFNADLKSKNEQVGSKITYNYNYKGDQNPFGVNNDEVHFQMLCQDGNWEFISNASSSPCQYPGLFTSVIEMTLGITSFLVPRVFKHGEEWLVIQRRCNGQVPFNRSWQEYKYGFGHLETEFWIGNEIIHQLSINGYETLGVEVYADHLLNAGYYRYFSEYEFKVDSEVRNYRAQFNFLTGNLSDSLTYFNGMNFSTWDKDNDNHTTANCAANHHGGWWFGSCHPANLNGLYGVHQTVGLSWWVDRGIWIYPTHTMLMMKKNSHNI
ncbi:ficolin-1-B-like [Saccostrea cucullata]|uniref:ficolin-1-B-like n=1 Tax=Saccostrea cuccullata TaxID=36930 RepID=UPI002ED5D065